MSETPGPVQVDPAFAEALQRQWEATAYPAAPGTICPRCTTPIPQGRAILVSVDLSAARRFLVIHDTCVKIGDHVQLNPGASL